MSGVRTGGDPSVWKVTPLVPQPLVTYAAPDPDDVHVGCPSIAAMPGGTLVAAFDQSGPGVKHVQGAKGRDPVSGHWLQGKVLASRDAGVSWTVRKEFPFCHPCLFRDGQMVYLFGLMGGVRVMKSADGGLSWSNPVALGAPGDDVTYAHSPARPLVAGDYVYLALLKVADPGYQGDPVSVLALELWRARQGADLADRRNWSLQGTAPAFRDLLPVDDMNGVGAPFFRVPDPQRDADMGGRRWACRPGLCEPILMRVEDPAHVWHDPRGATLLAVAPLRAQRANTAIAVQIRLLGDGVEFGFPCAPSGKRFTALTVPGGSQPFDLLYDEPSRLYWLVSNLCGDSVRRVASLPRERAGLPDEESHRLQLAFSRNLVDWCFAGLVHASAGPAEMRFSPSMTVRGGDLCVLCRGASPGRKQALHTDQVLLCVVNQFRELAY